MLSVVERLWAVFGPGKASFLRIDQLIDNLIRFVCKVLSVGF